MTMSGYELVRRAIKFDGPERVPMCFGVLGFDDTFWADLNLAKPHAKEADDSHRITDEWGNVWVTSEMKNIGQCKGHRLESWDALNDYVFPDPDDQDRYVRVEEQLTHAGGKYVLGGYWAALWERAQHLRGMANVMMDLYLEEERLSRLLDRILDFHVRVMDQLGRRFGGRIHGYSTTDDWGTQNATLISPELFDKYFAPRYRKWNEAAHRNGMHSWLHTCGKVNAFLGRFRACGFDVVNLQQPRLLGIEEVGRQHRGKMCFLSLVDIQRTLTKGTPEEIRAEARLLLEKWGTPQGGFIVGDYGDGEAIGVSLDRKQIMFDAFMEYGKLR